MNKGLEALERLKKVKVEKETPMSATFLVHDKRYTNDLLIIEKELKALEIIRSKKVNVENFVNACSKMSYEQYKFMWSDGCFMGINMTSKEFLTQEEFELLKEVLL